MIAVQIPQPAAVGVRELCSRVLFVISACEPFHSPLATSHSPLPSRSENLSSPLRALCVPAPLCVKTFSSFFLTASQFPSLLP